MDISGYASTAAADYYAELVRRRAGANQSAESDPAVLQSAAQGAQPIDSAPDFQPQPVDPAAASPAADAAAGSVAAGAMSGPDLLNLLGNQAPVAGSASGSFANTDSARGSIFNEMLKSFGVSGDYSRARQYMQETIRQTYGIM